MDPTDSQSAAADKDRFERPDLRAALVDESGDEELLFADGFDLAILGTTTRNSELVVVYSIQTCISVLMERDGMSEEDANEFFDFNVTGASAGSRTPVFIDVAYWLKTVPAGPEAV